MNRLVIIGNGFDLAHGLPTRYKDFIDDYWKTACDTKGLKTIKHNSDLVDIDCEFGGMYNTFDYEAIDNLNSYDELKKFVERNNQKNSGNFLIDFKNKFFNIISEQSIQNWVDIENIYYEILKARAKGSFVKYNYPWDVKQLNEELEQVKNLLENYLKDKVLNKYDLNFTNNQNIDWTKIYNYLRPISLLSNEGNVLKEFINFEDVKEITEHFDKERKEELVNNLYFLNFNYTPIATIYSDLLGKDDRIETTINFIHGEVDNKRENKINFGFGDEMDDDYKMIENINDNEYLKNFKSFQYLQNSNYSKLLSFIDSDKFQVIIMGHSCGLSDRTLLNTIFEHNYCRSIKVFYHQWRDKESEEIKDNYTEITQNISRHFNKKKLMREKIVNKTLCQPLPQIQLPKKE